MFRFCTIFCSVREMPLNGALTRMLFWFCAAVLLNFGGVLIAETKDAQKNEISSLIESSGIDGLQRIAISLEEKYVKTHDAEYFMKMNTLCEELARASHKNVSLMALLIHCASSMILKDVAKEQPAVTVYVTQRNAIISLLTVLTPFAPANQEWVENRSRACRLTMIFTSRIKMKLIPDYKPEEAYLNGPRARDLPSNPSDSGPYALGGDPSDIKDPDVRSRYMAAIKKNTENLRKNAAQRELARITKEDFPRLENEIVRLYSVPPIAYEELFEYLKLGGFSSEERLRIIGSIAKKIGMEPPTGLLNE